MTVHSIIPLLAAIIYIVLFLVVLFNRPWQRQHKYFIFYLIAAMVWALSDFFLRTTLLTEYLILIFRITVCSSIWWALQLFMFSRSYLNMKGGPGVWFGICGLVLLTILAILGYAPPSIITKGGLFVSPEYGWWLSIYIIPLLSLVIMGGYSLVKKLKITDDPRQKNRISYFVDL